MTTYTAADAPAIRLALLSIVSGVDLLDNRPSIDDAERASIRDILEQYAPRLTPEARREWHDYRAARTAGEAVSL